MSDLDRQFNDLVSGLDKEMPNPDAAISIVELSEAMSRLNEAGMYIADYITLAISSGEKAYPIPQGVAVALPALINVCLEVSDLLHDITCEDCMGDDDEDGDWEEDDEDS